jgi:hypothetical protein
VADRGTESAIPVAYRDDRYEGTWNRNPFLAKTVAPPTPPTNPFEDWELSGFLGRGENQTALIRNRKTAEFKRVTSTPDKDGFRLVKASPSRMRKDTSATIAQGSIEGELKFSDTPTAPAPGFGGKPMPGQQPPVANVPAGMPNNGARQVGNLRPGTVAQPPAMPVPNANRGVVPQPNAARMPGTAGAGLPQAVPNNGAPNPVSRRRVLIPSPTAPGSPVP